MNTQITDVVLAELLPDPSRVARVRDRQAGSESFSDVLGAAKGSRESAPAAPANSFEAAAQSRLASRQAEQRSADRSRDASRLEEKRAQASKDAAAGHEAKAGARANRHAESEQPAADAPGAGADPNAPPSGRRNLSVPPGDAAHSPLSAAPAFADGSGLRWAAELPFPSVNRGNEHV